jgi:signal transduction histidine kinase
VQDDGPSNKINKIEKIFNHFAQIERHLRTDKEEGLALGLPIAKELLKMHGGRIWVENTDAGTGNNFCFALPKLSAEGKIAAAVKASESGHEN